MPTVPPGSDVVVIVSAEPTIMLRLAEAVAAAASVALIVKLKVPEPVGVPEMTPVLGLRVNPPGNAPAMIAHVYGGVPPTACTVWAYGLPMLPGARPVVEMLRGGCVTTILRFALFVAAVGV